MPTCAKATASPSRTVMRRLSEASAMFAPPVQDFEGVFQTMVVSEASTPPAAFSRTMPLPTKRQGNSLLAHRAGDADRRSPGAS
jgi:hypothetical protein